MNVKLNEDETIAVLKILLDQCIDLKMYFKKCPDKTEEMYTPEEMKIVYNKILQQIREGKFKNVMFK